MPEVSRFYGLVIYMFFIDHNPPHFKVVSGEYEANILIENGDVLNGYLTSSKLKIIQAWAEIHKDELQEIWDKKIFKKINPLQ